MTHSYFTHSKLSTNGREKVHLLNDSLVCVPVSEWLYISLIRAEPRRTEKAENKTLLADSTVFDCFGHSEVKISTVSDE